MESVNLTAYLYFTGNCREAMAFYQRIFGGKIEVMTFGEIDNNCPEAMKESVMHASLMGGRGGIFWMRQSKPKPLRHR